MNESTNFLTYMPEISRTGSFSFVFWAVSMGIFLSVVINMGPAFITLIQTSIHRGFRPAGWFALGVLLNDAMIVSLCVLTSVQVAATSHHEVQLFAIGAGIILLLFGVFTYIKKVKDDDEVMKEADETEKQTQEILDKKKDTPSWIIFLGKGFAMNILNPFVWFFWFSAVAVVAGNMRGNKISTLLFFAILLGSALAVELLKAMGAASLKRFFNAKRLSLLNKIVGIALMGCGLYFIIFKGILVLI